MKKLPVYILAGGKNSRFGSDKARALYKDIPLIVHVKQSLSSVAESIKAITDQPDKYNDLQIESIVDVFPDKGPLGGLYTAITDMKNEGWFLLVQCDLVGIKTSWIEMLLAHTNEEDEAVIFRDGKYWQVIPGLFHTRIKQRVFENIQQNILKVALTIDDLHTKAVPLPENWNDSKDVNSLEDLNILLSDTKKH